MPFALSFFVFKAISFIVDSYKGKVGDESIISILNYLMFFPQLTADPISRYNETRFLNTHIFYSSCVRFMEGFIKKVFLANTIVRISEDAVSQIGGVLERGKLHGWVQSAIALAYIWIFLVIQIWQ